MGVVSVTILLWDHIITFDDEVEYVWKGKKGPLVYLFFLNRYLTPPGFVINLLAYTSYLWSSKEATYEGAMTMTGITIAAIMMLIRILAMYCHRMAVVWSVFFLLVVQVAVNAWLLTKATSVMHNPEGPVHSCTGIYDPKLSPGASAASAYIPLVYDTVVFCLVIYKTLPSRWHGNVSKLLTVLRNDALLYYSIIFSVTLVSTLMIASAEPGIRNVTAQLQLLITVTMMSRISIHLKRQHKRKEQVVTDTHAGVSMSPSGEVPDIAIQSILHSLPQLSFETMTWGSIRDTGNDMSGHNARTANMRATSGGRGQGRVMNRPNPETPIDEEMGKMDSGGIWTIRR